MSVRITKQQIDKILKSEKGWICNKSGNEYIYDFHLLKYPIIIKVASSIKIDIDRPQNKNSNSIRIFAIEKEGLDVKDKIKKGLIKSRIVFKTSVWRNNIKKQVYSVISSSKLVYDKYRRKNGR